MARRFFALLTMATITAVLLTAGCGDSKTGVINSEQYGRVQKGMTLDEVEAITGTPLRSHSTGPTQNPSIIWYFDKADGEGLVRFTFVNYKVDSIAPYDQSVPLEE
ncbi:MAG: hypothetical protein ACYC6B_06025 [Thermoleophilia bacterium]